MENTTPNSENSLVFDLKGSSIDRFVPLKSGPDFFETDILKDENFRLLGKKIKMSLKESAETLEILQEDMRVLRDIGVMDYSLLLVMSNDHLARSRYSIGKNYYLAIIDLFQVYDSTKAFERWFKIYIRRVDKNLISVISPFEYFQRLLEFVQSIFSEKDIFELV